MTIEVANVGPIRHAQLSLGNLNVLIGTNDTGKTFFATVVHRLLAASTDAYFPDTEPADYIPKNIHDYVREFKTTSRRSGGQDSERELVIDDEMRTWANGINESTLQRFGKAARRGISYAYGAPTERLLRQPLLYSRHESYMFIKNLEPRWSVRIKMDGDNEADDYVCVSRPNPDTWLRDVFNPALIQRLSAHYEFFQSKNKNNEVDPIQDIEELCQYILYMTGDVALFRQWPKECLHLPSERGGIMQSYRGITSAALRKSAFAGIEPVEIEPLDGTSRDFLSFVVSSGSEKPRLTSDKSYANWAKNLEKNLRAKIELLKNPSGLDRIVATTPEGQFELNQTSSMISEVSPFVLALKHRLGTRDYLTIDEPEAHLHPEMQIEIAKCLVDLASKGLTITFTTHSNYFVEQISNGIRSSELETHGEEELPPIPRIDPENVRALLFVRDDNGCAAIDATGDSIDPIKEETFTKAARAQYEQSVPLINRLLERVNATGEVADQ